jgi:hypothetical protein
LGAASAAEIISRQEEEEHEREQHDNDPHLRSTEEVIGYQVQAQDGMVGSVEDLIVGDELWSVNYLVIETQTWLEEKKVMLAPTWAENVNWIARKIYMDLNKETIRNSPEFDPSIPINREYEGRLYDYYGRPKYLD